MLDPKASIWWVLILSLMAGTASARTWFVERDGSGEFVSIHDAMEACAAGDTIRIGPGRYDDFHPFTASAWTTEAIVGVTKDNLTFIGDSDSTTIIGPTEMYLTMEIMQPMAVVAVDYIDAFFVNIKIENSQYGLYWGHGRVELYGCRFDECKNGISLLNEGGAQISRSMLNSGVSESVGVVTSSPCGPVEVSGCIFDGPIINEVGISLNGTSGAIIDNCLFRLRTGVVMSGSSGVVNNCRTTEVVAGGCVAANGSRIELLDNYLHGGWTSVYAAGWSVIEGAGNILSGGEELATIYISTQSQVTLNGNDILKTGRFAAMIGQYFYEIVTNDLTGNYWGTSDPDSIAAWVWDYRDDPVTRALIDYDPFSSEPLPTQKQSLDGFRAMFR